MDSIPKELQNVALPPDELARAVAVAKPTNEKVRRAADARLRFDDEPAAYTSFLNTKP